jgi:hypothetical protein
MEMIRSSETPQNTAFFISMAACSEAHHGPSTLMMETIPSSETFQNTAFFISMAVCIEATRVPLVPVPTGLQERLHVISADPHDHFPVELFRCPQCIRATAARHKRYAGPVPPGSASSTVAGQLLFSTNL